MEHCKVRQAVILAGGLGTRLAPFTEHAPKPMYCFEGRPFLEYLIMQVKSFGIKDIVLLLGYLPQKIMDYFLKGEQYGVHITYRITPVEYDTGARIKMAEDILEDHFLLMYCDNYCPIDFSKLQESYFKNHAMVQITAYANKDGYTKDNLLLNGEGQVLCYDKKRTAAGLKGVDIGYAIISKQVLNLLPEEGCNFEALVYPEMVKAGRMFAEVTEHRYYSIGSWQRIELTRQFLKPVKTIFLDRDGTLNVKPAKACYVESPKEFVWIDGAREAVALLKKAGYRVILVSNQPGITKGNLTIEKLDEIHNKMQSELEEKGGTIDAIYYCPHNWDDGCDCRKPKPGMFYQAQKDYSLNLTKCVMIGDDERDMEAAKAAGCIGILIDDNYTLLQAVKQLLGNQGEDDK